MATDGPNPTPCDYDIFHSGKIVYQTNGVSSNRMENWVKKIAEESGQRVDWHFFAGWAIVKMLGDIDAVEAAIKKHLPELDRLRAESLSGVPQ